MAISVNAVSGAYFANYGGEYVGITEDGYELEQTTFAEPIRGDNLGDSIQDEVYRGTDVFLNFVLIEYNQAVAASGGTDDTPIFHPHDDVLGLLGKPGVLRGSFSGSGLALTRYSADTTATAVTLTLTKSVLASNFPVRLLMANRLKKIPMRMQAFPNYTEVGTTAGGYTALPAGNWYVWT